jgi:putative oxidoreductase
VQRLFTTFANGWPGFGLLLQRLVIAIALFHQAAVLLMDQSGVGLLSPQAAGAILGLLILVGLWTPVVGVLIAAVETWIAFGGGGNVWLPAILAVLGGTLAMIGPGARSVDARLFGRKHI